RRVAASVLCECGDAARAPCGQCSSCRRVEAGTHPDTLVLEPAGASRQIPVWMLRPDGKHPAGSRTFFMDWVAAKSFEGGWKVGTILFADRMNPTVSNAILKTLEEPPENTLFLLVTAKPADLLPTIRSRCLSIDLSTGRVPPEEPWRSRVAEILAGHSDASGLRVAATSARLCSLFDEIKELAESDVNAELKALADSDPANWVPPSKDEFKALVKTKEKERREAVYEAMEDWYRDLLALRATPAGMQPPAPFFPEHAETLAARAAATPLRLALKCPDFVREMRYRIEERYLPPSFVFPYGLAWMK
ncbi:MAG: hypothetical protein IJ678_02600, partial [Kiritimatiellae bacterium]|nr:hypothetical protein [Kiritimatiellia bacterium]